jgi:peptide/nickel transport system permease protein
MMRYTLRRLSFLPIIVFAVSILVFCLLRVLPTEDIADVLGGQNASQQQKEQIREEFGLKRPIFPVSAVGSAPFIELHRHSQYGDWLLDAVRGDFGKTYTSGKSVREEFQRGFPASFEIVSLSLAFSVIFGVTFGVISAMYRNRLIDYVVRIFAVLGTSIPEFFLLSLLIIIPSYFWRYSMPVGGYVPVYEDPWTNLRLFVPAALVIGIGGSSSLMRLVRTTMLEVLRSDYVRTASAKGLPQHTVIITHALKNAGTPIATAVGTAFIAVFGGSVIAEKILSIHGVGLFFFFSTQSRDLPVIQFLAVYTAAVVVVINLLVDLSYAWIDPRVKYS